MTARIPGFQEERALIERPYSRGPVIFNSRFCAVDCACSRGSRFDFRAAAIQEVSNRWPDRNGTSEIPFGFRLSSLLQTPGDAATGNASSAGS